MRCWMGWYCHLWRWCGVCRCRYGSVKYFDLKQNPLSDYEFNYDRMLNADGDTAVYLQVRRAAHHTYHVLIRSCSLRCVAFALTRSTPMPV
jgi:hypothetical protein